MQQAQRLSDFLQYALRHDWAGLFGRDFAARILEVKAREGDAVADEVLFDVALGEEDVTFGVSHRCGAKTSPLAICTGADKLVEGIVAAGWQGDAIALAASLRAWEPQLKSKRVGIQVEPGDRDENHCVTLTVEGLFGWTRRPLERWLDFLQEQGLCLPVKAAAVLEWFDTPPQLNPCVQCNVSNFTVRLEAGTPCQVWAQLRLSQRLTRTDYDRLDTPTCMNLELTSRCPLRCPQCYCDLAHGKDLALDQALYWIEEAHRNAVHSINLSGGETLVYPHLLQLVEACAQRGMEANVALSGYGVTDEVLDRLIAAGVGGIFISLNGSTEEVGSRTRDGYELAIHALELLSRKDFDRVHINWVMHSNNAGDFPNMLTLCERHRVPNITVMVFKPDSSHQLPSAPTGPQMHAVAQAIRDYKGPVNIDIEGCFSQMRALVYQGFMGNLNTGVTRGCMAGVSAVSINVDGKITPCRHLEIPEETRSIRDYWRNSPTLRALREAAHNPKQPCLGCKLQANCLPCMAFNVKLHGAISYGTRECPLAND
jgi:radical SAM protein with 4Fe4S-binding SPASM domain